MKKLVVVFLAVALTLGCASVPKQIPETMKQACALYQAERPNVIAAREYAKAHWNEFSPEAQKVLLQLDEILPQLDAIGQVTCDLSTMTLPNHLTWDDALSILLKAIQIAVDLKAKGLI